MESTRQLKVARLLQKELAELFMRESPLPPGAALISVTLVRISPDLSHARVYLSIFGTKGNQETFLQVQEHQTEIRRRLGARIRKQLRVVPELSFYLDDSVDYASKINELLKK